MADLKLTTSVAAHPDHVWATLADFEGYPRWHPLVRRVKVSTDWSTKIIVRVGRKRTLRLAGSLIEHDPPRLIKWDGQHRLWGLLRVRFSALVFQYSRREHKTAARRHMGTGNGPDPSFQ